MAIERGREGTNDADTAYIYIRDRDANTKQGAGAHRAQAHRHTYRGFHLRCHAGFAVVVMRARAVTVE